MRDPDQVFEDVMRFSEEQIPPPEEFSSRSDLMRYLEEANPQMRGRSISTMIDSSAAEQLIFGKKEKTELTELRKQKPKITRRKTKGVLFEIMRSNRARIRDESQTRNVLKSTDANFKKWRKNPQRFDFRGLDTKTHSTIKAFIKQKSQRYTQQGLKIFNDRDVHVFVVRNDKRGRPFAQNIVTGRRVPKATTSKFGDLRTLVKRK